MELHVVPIWNKEFDFGAPSVFGKDSHVGGCQNYGPFLDPYYNTAPDIQGTLQVTIILTTTHVLFFDPLPVYASSIPTYLARGPKGRGSSENRAASLSMFLDCLRLDHVRPMGP